MEKVSEYIIGYIKDTYDLLSEDEYNEFIGALEDTAESKLKEIIDKKIEDTITTPILDELKKYNINVKPSGKLYNEIQKDVISLTTKKFGLIERLEQLNNREFRNYLITRIVDENRP